MDADDILIALILLVAAMLHGEVSTISKERQISDSAIFGENYVAEDPR